MKLTSVGQALLVVALVAGGVLLVSQTGSANGRQTGSGGTVVAALGTSNVQGERAVVEVLLVVPPGADARAAARAALAEQGARPFEPAALGSDGFTITGLVWDTLPVVQNYNPTGEPAGLSGGGQTALTNTHTTWDGVATSDFDIDFGGTTDRCPSLVKECFGPQVFDGNNDVGWLRMGGRTLGVTWYGTSTDEADMALNTRYAWNAGCTDVSGSYDAQSVFLHENGHVVGLGHSDDSSAVMWTPYLSAQCGLAQDDIEGATYLYPTQAATVSGTVTDAGGPVSGATVALAGTGLSAETDVNGDYAITGVPYTVTYDISASASGHETSTVRLQVDQNPETANFILGASGGDGGGGGPPCSKNPTHPNCRP